MPLEVKHNNHLIGVADDYSAVSVPGADGLKVVFNERSGTAMLVHGDGRDRRTLSVVSLKPGGTNYFNAPTLILPANVEQTVRINLKRF